MKSFKKFSILIFLGASVLFTFSHGQSGSYEIKYSWKQLDFLYNSPEQRDQDLLNGAFIPENNILVGIKVFRSKLYLSVPRWRRGVPSTLNVVDMNNPVFINNGTNNSSSSPLLVPFPSWEMQEIGNCQALQFIMSMEIDEYGRMWIVDVGRRNFQEDPEFHDNTCPPKIIVIDLETRRILRRHTFPQEVVSRNTSFLNDITVGCETGSANRCWCYINDQTDAKLVIYSFEEDRSHFVYHPSFRVDPNATFVPILGRNYSFPTSHINGIALSPKSSQHDRLYYNPLSSFSLFSAPTSALKNASNGQILSDEDVTVHTTQRASQMAGMAMDSNGILYYGQLRHNSLVYVNTSDPNGFQRIDNLLIQSDEDMQWPDCFGFGNDSEGHLYFTTNRLQKFTRFEMNWNDVNFRVIRTVVGAQSAIY